MLLTLFYFFLALFILVIVHEYGHFQVARWCGVKVLRFSFGFGKVLAKWEDKKGTEYVLSLIPIGGYVNMLDETEAEVLAHEKQMAFNRQPTWKKTAIVLAGPLFNFLLALVALWLVALIGIKSLAPYIEAVKPGSLMAEANVGAKQELLAINQEKIESWHDFQYAMMPYLGSNETINLKLQSLKNGEIVERQLSLKGWTLDSNKPDLLGSLGIVPFIPTIKPIIGEVIAQSPAEKSGLKVKDKILAVDNVLITDWLDVVAYLKDKPDAVVMLNIARANKSFEVKVQLGHLERGHQLTGFLGLRSEKADWPKDWLRVQKKGALAAIPVAFNETLHLTATTLKLLGRLVTGKLSIDNISGPVGIAKGAGESARGGLVYYLSFLALVSISLAVLNLLPVPLLDGGHLLFYFIEAFRRKPLSEEVKAVGAYLGLCLIAVLMIIALYNDVTRLAAA